MNFITSFFDKTKKNNIKKPIKPLVRNSSTKLLEDTIQNIHEHIKNKNKIKENFNKSLKIIENMNF